jgi:hypothetical protein
MYVCVVVDANKERTSFIGRRETSRQSHTVFYRWRRMEEEDRRRVWRLYGWVSGLMAFGSCVGAVTWAARMMQLVSSFKANGDAQSLLGANDTSHVAAR